MPRTTILLEDHTDGILTMLNTTTLAIGDGVAPRESDKTEMKPPHATLYALGGGDFDGPLSDTQADVSLLYQITAVGNTRQQAQVVQDIIRTVFKRENLTITNRVVRDIRLTTPNSGVVRDDDLPNPLFYGYDRYEVDTTPS